MHATPAPHAIQPRRHGGARPGAGCPPGPRRATLAWQNLVAILVAREVGLPALRLMTHHKVLLLAARIFMCDGDYTLAERAYREASRLFRKGVRHADRPRSPNPDPTQFKTEARRSPAPRPARPTPPPTHRHNSNPTQFKPEPHRSPAPPSFARPNPPPTHCRDSNPTQFKIQPRPTQLPQQSVRPPQPTPGAAQPTHPAPTLFKTGPCLPTPLAALIRPSRDRPNPPQFKNPPQFRDRPQAPPRTGPRRCEAISPKRIRG